MKTNSSARRLVRIRAIAMCVALLGLVATAFAGGGFLATRFAQNSAGQSDLPQVPQASIGELLAVTR